MFYRVVGEQSSVLQSTVQSHFFVELSRWSGRRSKCGRQYGRSGDGRLEGEDPSEGNNWGDRGTGECLKKVESARLIQLCLCIAMARWCRQCGHRGVEKVSAFKAKARLGCGSREWYCACLSTALGEAAKTHITNH